MITSYKNNQRHESLEMVVSRGQVDFNAAYNFGGSVYIGYNVIGGNDTSYPISDFFPFVFKTPDHNILPRGIMMDSNSSHQQMQWSNLTSANTNFGNGYGWGNFLAAPPMDGAVYNSSPSSDYVVLDAYTPFIESTRPTYHSKIFPIFAQGEDNYSNIPIEILNIELPYIKAEVLRGEITNLIDFGIVFSFGENSSQVKSYMREVQYFNYPVYNAIEVLFCTKSLQPSGNYYKGGAWYKKVFLINYDLYETTETPFPGQDSTSITRHYWRPTGIAPQSFGLPNNNFDEKINDYDHDHTATSTNAVFNLASIWLPTSGINTEVIQDNSNKKATLKATINLQANFLSSPELYSLKGIAKLI